MSSYNVVTARIAADEFFAEMALAWARLCLAMMDYDLASKYVVRVDDGREWFAPIGDEL